MPKRNFNTNLTKQERERIGELVKALRSDSGISQKYLAFKVFDQLKEANPENQKLDEFKKRIEEV